MTEENFQDKTEPATPRRREEARKKGQVAKSRELSSIAVLSAGVLYLYFGARYLTESLGRVIQSCFRTVHLHTENAHDLVSLSISSMERFIWIALPIMSVLMMIALAINLLQTGFLFSVETLSPKASKIDPIKGAQRIFSKRSLVELAKSIAKLVIVGWVAFSTLKSELRHMIPLLYQDKIQIISVLGESAFKVTIRCCAVLTVLAILDFIYQRWEHEQKLRMTKQEVKDEYRHTEGDPLVKSRIRSLQREIARRKMMEKVPGADVVIANPDRPAAVALRYDRAGMSVPGIPAKGTNKTAERIRTPAGDHDIPLVEDGPLAKSRIRSLQREIARRRMMEKVPGADVVIANPNRPAVVALRYDQAGMSAPRVLAKGANKTAERIRTLAGEHDIPLVEDKSLAQNLYKLNPGEEIPRQLYQAVAKILAHVHDLGRK